MQGMSERELIVRFLDPQARILFVDPDQVVNVARECGGVPFDIKDVELSHVGERCSFDTMLELFGLESEPSLARLALIVRGADTARPDIAAEAAGLHAVWSFRRPEKLQAASFKVHGLSARASRLASDVQEVGALRGPSGIAVRGEDHAYVADTGNHRILRLKRSGEPS